MCDSRVGIFFALYLCGSVQVETLEFDIVLIDCMACSILPFELHYNHVGQEWGQRSVTRKYTLMANNFTSLPFYKACQLRGDPHSMMVYMITLIVYDKLQLKFSKLRLLTTCYC